jgi:hypothetical protein
VPVVPPAGGIAGTWNGTFKSTNNPSTGAFRMTVTLEGNVMQGTVAITTGGSTVHSKLAGTISGSTISFGALKGIPVSFTGLVNGDRMSGTYQSSTDTGTWKATRAA